MVDQPYLKAKGLETADDDMKEFIASYFMNGAVNSTYKARTKVLSKAFNIQNIKNLKTLDCTSTVLNAADKIFENSFKNFIVEHQCDCFEYGNKVLTIDLNDLKRPIKMTAICTSCEANANIKANDIMFINGNNIRMKFNEIPNAVFLAEKIYCLLAIVELKSDTSKEHYVANISRCNQKWYIFDSNNPKVQATNFKEREIVVHLICYAVSKKTSTDSQVLVNEPDRKIEIIQNFHNYHLNGTEIRVEMACGPDSLLHCLCQIYLENSTYFLAGNTNEWLMLVMESYAQNDVEKLYYARVKLLLEKGFKFSANLNGIATIQCTSNISSVLQMLEMRSSTVKQSCQCGTKFRDTTSIEVDLKTFKEEAILSHTERSVCAQCKHTKIKEAKFENIIYIDTQASTEIIPLSNVPQTIKLNEANYRIAGAIEYQPSKTQQSHYVAHYKHNGVWIEYDDLAHRTKRLNDASKMRLHLLIYLNSEI